MLFLQLRIECKADGKWTDAPKCEKRGEDICNKLDANSLNAKEISGSGVDEGAARVVTCTVRCDPTGLVSRLRLEPSTGVVLGLVLQGSGFYR